MLENTASDTTFDPIQRPSAFSGRGTAVPEKMDNAHKQAMGAGTSAADQLPLVFCESESEPLGFSNKLLRKAAYGLGVFSFVLTGLSGVSNKNHWRTAAGFGSAGINVASLFMEERDEPLPDTAIPGQMAHALLHPGENNLFFNRSASFITDILKFAAGLESARKTEIMEGVWKIGTKAIEIGGISDQNKREKLALINGQNAKENDSPFRKIFANRWVSLSSSAVAAGLQIAQGVEHRDKKMITSGISYLMAVSSLCADNAIMESKIKKTKAERER